MPRGLIDVIAGDQPGLRTTTTFTSTGYLDLARLTLPLVPQGRPLETVPLTDRVQTLRVFDDNLRLPMCRTGRYGSARAHERLHARPALCRKQRNKVDQNRNINNTNIFENGLLGAFLEHRRWNFATAQPVSMGLKRPRGQVLNGTTITSSRCCASVHDDSRFLCDKQRWIVRKLSQHDDRLHRSEEVFSAARSAGKLCDCKSSVRGCETRGQRCQLVFPFVPSRSD